MAKANRKLIQMLRKCARSLENPSVEYKWSHFAHCNCGNLVQIITGLEPSAIQRQAFMHQQDWGQQAHAYRENKSYAETHPSQPDYGHRPALDEGAWEPENLGACSTSSMSLDFVFKSLEVIGLAGSDFEHLERLSDPSVRRRMKNEHDYFAHYKRENVTDYLWAWADDLQDKLPECEKYSNVSSDIFMEQQAQTAVIESLEYVCIPSCEICSDELESTETLTKNRELSLI